MKMNFSTEVRQALALARDFAVDRGHGCIAPAHLLVGLLRLGVPTGEGPRARSELERAVAATVPAASRVDPPTRQGEVPYDRGAKKALELAFVALREAGETTVSVEHLLQGVLGAAPDLESLWSSESESSVWYLKIDPEADQPLYEQIIERVKEAVAVGQLTEGEKIPPVREMAAELGIAPGTVARAYSSLEEQGVVVAEGARGTRVAPPSESASSQAERLRTLEGLLRPVVIAAFHLGARVEDLRCALEEAMNGIYDEGHRDPAGA